MEKLVEMFVIKILFISHERTSSVVNKKNSTTPIGKTVTLLYIMCDTIFNYRYGRRRRREKQRGTINEIKHIF